MAVAWFGWSQEDPLPRWRWWLVIGSLAGLVFAGIFGFSVASRWTDASALEGRYEWFGVLVLVEVIAATTGSLYLQRRGRRRWAAWWVALVVAVHFIPLAFLVADMSLIILGVVQGGMLVALVKPMRESRWSTSRVVGPMMGFTMLLFALISSAMFVSTEGFPL